MLLDLVAERIKGCEDARRVKQEKDEHNAAQLAKMPVTMSRMTPVTLRAPKGMRIRVPGWAARAPTLGGK